MVFAAIAIPFALLVAWGIYEQREHEKNINSISIRINVNGIRGKSTVTRLITAIFTEAGYRTIGKTTGTSARMIYWNAKEETPIIRKPEGPNISEQRIVIKQAAQAKAEVLVSECMAVNPDYQVVYQEKMVQANVGVIVNVLEDHMDVMGPTLDDVAEAFTSSIPYNGHLIVTEGPYLNYFKQIAKERKTKVIVGDSRKISENFLQKFDYMIFPENAALALAVAKACKIPEKVAFEGMLKAHPDPGAMRITAFGSSRNPSYFINGFAANDASSTLNIWKRVGQMGYSVDKPFIIMNCRADRVDRTEQFARDVIPYLNIETLVLIGEMVSPIVEAFNQGQLKNVGRLINLEKNTTQVIMDKLTPELPNKVVYGIGNIHGAAEPLITKIMASKIGEKKHRGKPCSVQICT